MDKVLEYKEKISLKLERYDKIVELEKQTGVDKFYIFVVATLLLGVLLFVIGGEELVVGLVGFIYPAYMSFKALSTPGTDDDTQWLTYWVIYAFFNLTESVTDLILSWYVPPEISRCGDRCDAWSTA
jgi:receptor expression-enhancing protein 5/6